jgi:hypothetical protein
MEKSSHSNIDLPEKQSSEYSRHLLSEDGESASDQDFEQQIRRKPRRSNGTIAIILATSAISILLGIVIGHYSPQSRNLDRVCLQRTSRECKIIGLNCAEL